MSDFEKDKELRDKYSGVMGSIADDIRQINLEDNSGETVELDTVEFETDAKAVSEPDSIDYQAVESETDADDTIEFEAIKPETEIGSTNDFESAAPEAEAALSETSDAPRKSEFPEGSFDKFLESINRMSFDDDELQKSVLGDISEIGFDNTAPINTELFDTGGLDLGSEYSSYTQTDTSGDDLNAEDEFYPNTMACDECRELLYDYVSDATDETENKAIKAHLRDCEMCRMELDEIKDMLGVLSNSTAPAPPVNLVTSVRDKLEAAAPEVKAEYKSLKEKGLAPAGAIDFRNLLNTVKTKTDHFIKHANWRILAPAALSAILVVGVAGSGIYQVMKSSDEIYNFSDNAAIAEAGATARPSSSGLDEYVIDGGNSKSTASPRTTKSPSGSSAASSGGAAARATARPSAATSASAASRSSSSSSTAPRATTRPSTGTSTSSRLNLNNGTTSSTNSSNRTTSSATAAARTTPTPAPKAYVTPQIILPAISPSTVTSPTYVEPDSIVIPDDPAPPTFSYTQPTSAPVSAASTISGSAGGGERTTTAPATAKPSATTVPTASASATAAPSASASATTAPSASANASASASPSLTKDPNATAAPGVKRNDKGETEEFAQKANSMDKASVISCEITDESVLNKLLESDLAKCSKIDPETGEITLYYSGDEYLTFTGFLRENKLSYSLVVLGSNDDVKVIVTDSTKK